MTNGGMGIIILKNKSKDSDGKKTLAVNASESLRVVRAGVWPSVYADPRVACLKASRRAGRLAPLPAKALSEAE